MTGLDGGPGVLTQMVQAFAELGRSLLAVQEVPEHEVHRYGIVAGQPAGERMIRVQQMVEKPKLADAPSRMAVAGRYILTPQVFEELHTQTPGAGGEIQLTDAIAAAMKKEAVYAYQYEGKRYDCGSKEGFLQATVELGLKHPQVGASFREFLRGVPL
jgi:UTP--glucose-1-phosphate uridylyltransferase